jgi:hypothetical protein
MQATEFTEVMEDDLSHLANARLVRRVNDTSPVITTPALTNEESSQFSSTGSGPLSVPGNTPLHEPSTLSRPIHAFPRHSMAFPSRPSPTIQHRLSAHPIESLPPVLHVDPTRQQEAMYGNRGPDTSANDWSIGIPQEAAFHTDSLNHDMLHPLSSWFDSVPDPRLPDSTTDRFMDRPIDMHTYMLAPQVSPPTHTGLVLPFDQLDAYGIFMGRHDLMSDTVRDEEMPLLPGTNIEEFLARLDSNAL